MTKKKKLTYAETLLRDARRNPSRTCHDPRQLDLADIIRNRAFSKLDKAIEAALAESCGK